MVGVIVWPRGLRDTATTTTLDLKSGGVLLVTRFPGRVGAERVLDLVLTLPGNYRAFASSPAKFAERRTMANKMRGEGRAKMKPKPLSEVQQ